MKYAILVLSTCLTSIVCLSQSDSLLLKKDSSAIQFELTSGINSYSQITMGITNIQIIYVPPPLVKVDCNSYIYYGEHLVAVRYKNGTWKFYDRAKAINAMFNTLANQLYRP